MSKSMTHSREGLAYNSPGSRMCCRCHSVEPKEVGLVVITRIQDDWIAVPAPEKVKGVCSKCAAKMLAARGMI